MESINMYLLFKSFWKVILPHLKHSVANSTKGIQSGNAVLGLTILWPKEKEKKLPHSNLRTGGK